MQKGNIKKDKIKRKTRKSKQEVNKLTTKDLKIYTTKQGKNILMQEDLIKRKFKVCCFNTYKKEIPKTMD